MYSLVFSFDIPSMPAKNTLNQIYPVIIAYRTFKLILDEVSLEV